MLSMANTGSEIAVLIQEQLVRNGSTRLSRSLCESWRLRFQKFVVSLSMARVVRVVNETLAIFRKIVVIFTLVNEYYKYLQFS